MRYCFLLLFCFLTAETPALACTDDLSAPVINLRIVESEPHFDTRQPKAILASMPVDTISPYPEIGGILHAKTSVDHNIRFHTFHQRKAKTVCIAISRIDITLRTDPSVYIAEEYHRNPCLFEAAFAHEMEHMAVDKILLQKYSQQFQDGLRMAFRTRKDYAAGPLPAFLTEGVKDDMHTTVKAVIDVLFQKMMRERVEKQQEIDTHHGHTPRKHC